MKKRLKTTKLLRLGCAAVLLAMAAFACGTPTTPVPVQPVDQRLYTQVASLATTISYQSTQLAALATQEYNQNEFLSYEATRNQAQAWQLATLLPPTNTPLAYLDITPSPTPAIGFQLLANGDLDTDDFGQIENWGKTNIDTHRWYLVQSDPPESGRARWIERVDLSQFGRGFGLKSTDQQTCDYFCSVETVQIIPAYEYLNYVLTADARTDLGGYADLYMDFLDNNRVRISPYHKGASGEEWSTITVSAASPPGTRFIRVILYSGNSQTGVIYWDNVILKAIVE